MVRDRLQHPRRLAYLIVAWGLALALPPQPAGAAPLPPARADAAADDLDAVRTLLERKIIRERLMVLGVSSAEATAAVERFSPRERAELAARVDELGAGGSVAGAIVISIIVAMLVILILELTGRRVISRP